MRIIGARWTRKANLLLIECDCGFRHEHRSDRWQVKCPNCCQRADLKELREAYSRTKGETQCTN